MLLKIQFKYDVQILFEILYILNINNLWFYVLF